MTGQQITFLSAGFVAGIITAVIGHVWLGFLAVGVGLVFSVAFLAAVAITGSWLVLEHGLWRYLAGVGICTVAYVLALSALIYVGDFSPQLFGVPASRDIVDFHADIWLGLLAAAFVSSLCVELMAYVLTGSWSNSFLLRLIAAGFVTILVTFVANLPFHHYWSFLGTLLPVGEALFCWLVGTQILKTSRRTVQQA